MELKHPCLPYEYFFIVFLNHFNDFLLWMRDRYSSVKGILLLNMPKQTGPEKGWFGHAFRHRVTNFKPHFLSPQKSKLKNFSAHKQEEFLRISKLTLLLFIVPILKELWQFETSGHFFWDTLYVTTLCKLQPCVYSWEACWSHHTLGHTLLSTPSLITPPEPPPIEYPLWSTPNSLLTTSYWEPPLSTIFPWA